MMLPRVACASAVGGAAALIRCGGDGAVACVCAAGIRCGAGWQVTPQDWPFAGGALPLRVLVCPAGRSFTGDELVELTVPGSPVVVEAVCAALRTAGAVDAEPGWFSRRALANGRLRLDQAEGLLALVHAVDAPAAERALTLLRGGLGDEVAEVRQRLLYWRALVEAGLDFMDEEDVRAYHGPDLQEDCRQLAARLERWLRAAQGGDGLPLVALAGRANAGKSALFNRLTAGRALVSPVPGTTRDWLDAEVELGGRRLRLVDTAGWLDASASDLDAAALRRGRDILAGAALVVWCAAVDAPLPAELPAINAPGLVLATKADLAPSTDPRAACACSATTGDGCAELARVIADRLAGSATVPPRQREHLAIAAGLCHSIAAGALPGDELLADDLRRAAEACADLIGATTPDHILSEIFGRFCIGK